MVRVTLQILKQEGNIKMAKVKKTHVKSLGNREDIKTSREAVSDQSGQSFLKIPDKKTPFYLLDLEYRDGFAHWVELPNGRKMRVVCSGDLEKGGFDPENCLMCDYVMNMYKDAKVLRDEGDEGKADKLKKRANDMRGKYEAHMLAVRGEREIVREGGKKKVVANFDTDDADADVEVGILGLSHSQFEKLSGLIDDEDVPHVKEGADLGNRVIWSKKEKKAGKGKGQTFTEVSWTADSKKTPKPELEYDSESDELNIEADFDVNLAEVKKVYAQLTGGEVEDDEDVDFEEESGDVDDDFLDDDDDVEESDDDVEELDDDDDLLDDVDEDGDEIMEFVDDIPFEEEEEEEIPPKKTPKKSADKKRTSGTKSSGKKKSGRAKL